MEGVGVSSPLVVPTIPLPVLVKSPRLLNYYLKKDFELFNKDLPWTS